MRATADKIFCSPTPGIEANLLGSSALTLSPEATQRANNKQITHADDFSSFVCLIVIE